jgi:hypothetical protein
MSDFTVVNLDWSRHLNQLHSARQHRVAVPMGNKQGH